MGMRRYAVTLTTVGPVHIGMGRKIGKKDYFLQQGKICVLDPARFVERLQPRQLDDYCKFLEGDSRSGLEDFLDEHGVRQAAQEACAYRLDTQISKARRGTRQYLEADEFVKDAYGSPYVPGSSFKGMLRTALLAAIVEEDPREFVRILGRSRDDGKRIERKAFWVEKPDEGDGSLLRDIMRYVSVSDSDPLSVDDLTFAKKYDKFSKGDKAEHKRRMGNSSVGDIADGNELNIYRECLKPGTVVALRLDIDDRIDARLPFPLDAEHIGRILKRFEERYRACFLDHFDWEAGDEGVSGKTAADGRCRYIAPNGLRCRNAAVAESGYCNLHKDKAAGSAGTDELICYLGGGVDFDSKTVLNALYQDEGERLSEISHILFGQFPTKIDKDFAGGRHRVLWNEVVKEGFRPQFMKARLKGPRLIKAKNDHRHWMDQELGVSPHTLKLGMIGNKLFPMGRCSLRLAPLPACGFDGEAAR